MGAIDFIIEITNSLERADLNRQIAGTSGKWDTLPSDPVNPRASINPSALNEDLVSSAHLKSFRSVYYLL